MWSNYNFYIAIILIAALLFSFLTIYSFGENVESKISVSAHSAALYQPETNTFLYSKNADLRMPMASTTKIMTALVALEESSLDEIIIIDDRAVGIEGSSAYLKSGEAFTMEELLYALLLQSANDAAVAIANHIGGSSEGFAGLMNEKACSLGLEDTHFTNPHGLNDEAHYTTAYDLAKIAAQALKNEKFKEIVSTYKKTFLNDERSRTYVNHNKLLNLYEGCIGVKTGFTRQSGRCLVGAAEKDGLTFITVTLDAPNDWSDHKAMLDLGFNSLEKILFAKSEEFCYRVPVIEGEKNSIIAKNIEDLSIITEKTYHEESQYVKLVRYAIAPINKGDILGEIIYTLDGKEIGRINLVAEETVPKKKEKGLLDRILSLFNQ